MKRLPLISTLLSFFLFILLCVSCSYWALQFMQPPTRRVSAPPVAKSVADVASVAGLFGGAMAVNSNYQLKGIILANPNSQSGAIIALDGKPAEAFRVNAEISPGIKLAEVHAGYITIADNGINKRVDLQQEVKVASKNNDIVPSRYPAPAQPPANSMYPGQTPLQTQAQVRHPQAPQFMQPPPPGSPTVPNLTN